MLWEGLKALFDAAAGWLRERRTHVDQTYMRLATYRAADATAIEHQASIDLANAWGGGLVASVNGMRFVMPVPSLYARPDPKFFGRRVGATWLNMINDQAADLGRLWSAPRATPCTCWTCSTTATAASAQR
jgi:TnpA family transposase